MTHSLLLEARPNPDRGDVGCLLPCAGGGRHGAACAGAGDAPALPARHRAADHVRGLPRAADPAPPAAADVRACAGAESPGAGDVRERRVA